MICYLGFPLDPDYNISGAVTYEMKSMGDTDGEIYSYEGFIPCDESGLYGYSVRIMPRHDELVDRFDLENILWIGEKHFAREKSRTSRIVVDSR